MKNIDVLKSHLGQRVLVSNNQSGAKYMGILSGFRHRENRFCITKLCILHKNGDYKAISGCYETRWFDVEKYSIGKIE